MEDKNHHHVIERFRRQVAKGGLDDKIHFAYRAEGGMPSQRFEEGFTLSGSGHAWVMHHEVVRSIPRREAELELGNDEKEELFRLVAAGAGSLLTLEEAGFIPDSVVGTLLVEVEDARTTLFFLALERDRTDQHQPIVPEMSEALKRFREITRQALREKGVSQDA
jgi:hypothetical protein